MLTENKNKYMYFLYILSTVVLFVFTERVMRNAFCFGCAWRIITLYKYVFLLCSWIIFAVSIVLVFKRPYCFRQGKALILYLILYTLFFISTIINDGSIKRWLDSFLYSLPPILLCMISFGSINSTKRYLLISAIVFTILSILNILYIIFPMLWSLTPDFHQDYFLGFHSLVGFVLALGFLFNCLNRELNKNNVLFCVYFVSFVINIVLIRKGTTLIGGALIVICSIPLVKKIISKTKFWILLIIVVALFAILIFAPDILSTIKPLKHFIEDVLKKDVSLSGRTYLWADILNQIKRNPIIGHGFGETANIIYKVGHWNSGWEHAHNAFLQILFEGGIVALIPVAVMLVISGEKMDTEFKICLFAILIMLQADQDAYYVWYLPTFVCVLSDSMNSLKAMESSNGETIKPQTD